jgi:hypothetical protein
VHFHYSAQILCCLFCFSHLIYLLGLYSSSLYLFFLFCRFLHFIFNLHTSITPFSHHTTSITSSLPFSYLTGTDLGGLFKDFLTDLSARVFDPSYGLFLVTSDNLLYPNPSAILLYPEPGELEALYSFLGTHFINTSFIWYCVVTICTSFSIFYVRQHF